MTRNNSGSTENMPESESDREVVWFGTISGHILITLFMLLLIASFVGYFLLSSDVPPLPPLMVSVLTALFAAVLTSARWTSERVISSGGSIDIQDGTELGLLPHSLYGIPLRTMVIMATILWVVQPLIVFARTDSVRVAAFIGMEGVFAFALGYLVAVGGTLHAIDNLEGDIPSGFSGRFWELKPDYLVSPQQNWPENEESQQ